MIIAALVMVGIGVSGLPGVAAVLAVTAVVCCATAMAGDMIQDLKVGHLIGGTPWRMEVAELISTVVVSFVLVWPIVALHRGDIEQGGSGIGGAELPAPQAGLMAQLATGIVGGEMPWGLIVIGMMFSLAMILIKAPAPMLIAVGMYLPFDTTFAIFVGGLLRGLLDKLVERRHGGPEGRVRVANTGTLVASGLIAGEALMAVALAIFVVVGSKFLGVSSLTQLWTGIDPRPFVEPLGGWLSLAVFAAVAWALVRVPLAAMRRNR